MRGIAVCHQIGVLEKQNTGSNPVGTPTSDRIIEGPISA